MEIEIEAKWLNIDKNNMRAVLRRVGAKLVSQERNMIRRNYDYPDGRLDKADGWVRVRAEGDKVTMSYKQLNSRAVDGTKEISITVSDFDSSCKFLESIGLESKSFQETKRESWTIGNSEIEIDTWPWIPSFVEIEAKSKKELINVASKLGLDYDEALFGSVEPAYRAVYDVSKQEINSWSEIVFSEVPEWLAIKSKQDGSV